jgi:hypothetical protein
VAGIRFRRSRGGRALGALSLSLLLAWLLWLATSGNSRYFLPMSCLAAVVLASLLCRFSAKPRFLIYSTLALVAPANAHLGH